MDVVGDINFTGNLLNNYQSFTASLSDLSNTSSYIQGVNVDGAVETSSFAISASYTPYQISSSYTLSASYSTTSNNSVSASYSLTASYSENTKNIYPDIYDSASSIGIGQPNPQSTLDVNGDFGNSPNFDYYFGAGVGAISTINGRGGNLSVGTTHYNAFNTLTISGSVIESDNNYSFGVGNTPTVLAYNSGNVGIGHLSPINKLDVMGNISCSVITASLLGTASYSNISATASYIPLSIIIQTASYSILPSDYTVIMSGSSALSASLPTVSNVPVGKIYNIKNTSTYSLTITGSQLIDGQLNQIITSQYTNVSIQSDGNVWWII